MSCPHGHREFFIKRINEQDRAQDKLLAEGCCPNRCGPMNRIAPHTAACSCCGLEWTSTRIRSIFPSQSFK